MYAENASVAATARSSMARSRLAWYMPTMSCDHCNNCGAMLSGTPIMRAITTTGTRSASAGNRSNGPSGKASISWCARLSTSPSKASMRREVKARNTSARRRVWVGGSRSSIERDSKS